jgi:DNA-binding NarL/FixJ family response regulator
VKQLRGSQQCLGIMFDYPAGIPGHPGEQRDRRPLTVVNLIAQGATNRDVAEQLHLSLHTVHNAFAKLGINSREQLTLLMRGSE